MLNFNIEIIDVSLLSMYPFVKHVYDSNTCNMKFY